MQGLPKNLVAYRTPKDADRLAALLQEASDAYYNTGKPMISDDVFDMARDHLASIAPSHAFLKQVGAPVAEGEKVRLPYWMGSMNKIKDSEKELEKWVAKHPEGGYVVSDKLDGNSAMVVFGHDGRPHMYSRGDGEVGQDISQLLPHVRGIPPPDKVPKGLAVRGELIISRQSWDRIQHVGANARNVVAGALHRKVPDAEVAKHIDFVAYDLVHPRTYQPTEAFKYLAQLGFLVVFHKSLHKSKLAQESLSDLLMQRRSESPYECDGIIVAHNEVHRIVKGKNPTYAFAFKSIHTHAEAEVVVSHVEWNVSKDGYIKPTIHFPRVTIAGVSIQRATGFNGAFIEMHKIGPGARIVIIRSGDVIPHVVRVLQPSSQGVPQMPGIPFEWTGTHVDIVASEMDGEEQRMRTLEHFAKTLDIPFVAAGTIKKLVSASFDTIPKLLSITEADLLKIDGFKKVSASKVAGALKKVHDSATCIEMMAASNIFGRGMGVKKLQAIVKALPQVVERKLPSVKELQGIDGVGPATAEGFHNGLVAFFKLMDEIGIPCRTPKTEATIAEQMGEMDLNNDAFRDMVVVFTGFRAKPWEDVIASHGGKVTTSISKNTTLVVAANPDEASSKIEKAKELGIEVLSKETFSKKYNMLAQESIS